MNPDLFKPLLGRVATGAALTTDEATQAFEIMLRGQASEAQMAAFVSLLHLRGETAGEIAAAAQVLMAQPHPSVSLLELLTS